jgi:hypothetical protein
MKDNESIINLWLNEDKECLSLYISIIDNINQFYACKFKLHEKQGIRKIINKFHWTDIIKNNNNSIICQNYYEGSKESKRKINNFLSDYKSQINLNIWLKNKIIRLKKDLIYLRNLSVKCEINILMSGESNFYMFSRYAVKFAEYTTACYISKKF